MSLIFLSRYLFGFKKSFAVTRIIHDFCFMNQNQCFGSASIITRIQISVSLECILVSNKFVVVVGNCLFWTLRSPAKLPVWCQNSQKVEPKKCYSSATLVHTVVPTVCCTFFKSPSQLTKQSSKA